MNNLLKLLIPFGQVKSHAVSYSKLSLALKGRNLLTQGEALCAWSMSSHLALKERNQLRPFGAFDYILSFRWATPIVSILCPIRGCVE